MIPFEKLIAFTDIHFGNKGNSVDFNEDCTDFINWLCDVAAKNGCETCAFLGDWHHHRNTINVSTLNYTTRNLKKLNDSFKQVYFITGNHDLFFREKRDVHSLPMISEYPNIKEINDLTIIGDVGFMPWMVTDEWKKIKKLKLKYLFGHFEIPGFKLNAQIEMPDHGEINKSHFKDIEYVFSGHFHRRQIDANVHYIGNPFGHDFSTSWDFDHGCMILPYGGEPEYINWLECPKYFNTKLSKLGDDLASFTEKSYIRCEMDVDLSFEESTDLKEQMTSVYKVRDFKLVPVKNTEHTDGSDSDTIKFHTIDEIVMDEITNIENGSFKKEVLLGIYNDL